MMESRPTQKWLMISFFVSVSLVFVYFIFTLIMGATDSTYETRLEAVRTGPGSYRQDFRINLILDQAVTVDRLQLTYRGVFSGRIKLDVILLDLDPQYVYTRNIPVKNAKQGFNISGNHFRATSINGKRLRLVIGDE